VEGHTDLVGQGDPGQGTVETGLGLGIVQVLVVVPENQGEKLDQSG
jgi:hypothetical protein